MDLGEMFAVRVPIAEIIIRGSAVYWFLFLIFRFIIRRDIGAWGIADVLLLVILADAAQNAMAGGYESLQRVSSCWAPSSAGTCCWTGSRTAIGPWRASPHRAHCCWCDMSLLALEPATGKTHAGGSCQAARAGRGHCVRCGMPIWRATGISA